MDSSKFGLVKRLALALAAGAVLSGCVYAPPYAAYDAPYGYGYGPAYVGPPISLDLNYSEYSYRGGHGWRGGRGWRGDWRGRH
jgi:hypothetical protein